MLDWIKTTNLKLMIVLSITLIGFGLRLYRIGSESFWNDEAGQALAAIQPTIGGMLKIERSHAMAMPMDYLISWFTSRIDVSEAVMRLPSLVYGTLSIFLYFYFVERNTRLETAVIAAWLFALSVPHIRYSQEMRFYAALLMFYILSNIFLQKALRHMHTRNWGYFVFVTALGTYFHPYVFLSVINGYLYIMLDCGLTKTAVRQVVRFSAVVLVLGVLFLPGYLYFGAGQVYEYDFLLWTGSVWQGILEGLGWLSFPYTATTPIVGAWELTLILFTMVGLVDLVKKNKDHKFITSFIYGAVIQIILIILADIMKGYPFASRQLLHLAPTFLVLSGMGFTSFLDFLSAFILKHIAVRNQLHGLFIAVVLVATGVFAFPRIVDYYLYPKSNGAQVVSTLLEVYQEESPVYIVPYYEEKVYRFYLFMDGSARSADIIRSIRPTSCEALQQTDFDAAVDYFVIVPSIQPVEKECLDILLVSGFRIVLEPDINWGHNRFLLRKEQ